MKVLLIGNENVWKRELTMALEKRGLDWERTQNCFTALRCVSGYSYSHIYIEPTVCVNALHQLLVATETPLVIFAGGEERDIESEDVRQHFEEVLSGHPVSVESPFSASVSSGVQGESVAIVEVPFQIETEARTVREVSRNRSLQTHSIELDRFSRDLESAVEVMKENLVAENHFVVYKTARSLQEPARSLGFLQLSQQIEKIFIPDCAFDHERVKKVVEDFAGQVDEILNVSHRVQREINTELIENCPV